VRGCETVCAVGLPRLCRWPPWFPCGGAGKGCPFCCGAPRSPRTTDGAPLTKRPTGPLHSCTTAQPARSPRARRSCRPLCCTYDHTRAHLRAPSTLCSNSRFSLHTALPRPNPAFAPPAARLGQLRGRRPARCACSHRVAHRGVWRGIRPTICSTRHPDLRARSARVRHMRV